ncbi:MAG: methyltransferase domain-containing protein, partial [Chloroflexota bacterium]
EDNTFDFVYTNITLHHMEPKYAFKYLREFIRVLRGRGVLIFYMLDQCPGVASRPSAPRRMLQLLSRVAHRASELFSSSEVKEASEPVMEAYGINREEMVAFLNGLGAHVIELIDNNYRSIKEVFGEFDEGGYIDQIFASDPDPRWAGYWCIATKEKISQ